MVAGLADRIAVMYAGRIVEMGDAAAVLDAPRHPYSRGLLDSVPAATHPGARLRQIRGSTPSLLRFLGPGCAFRDRCDRATDECALMPPLTEHDGRAVRCVTRPGICMSVHGRSEALIPQRAARRVVQ